MDEVEILEGEALQKMEQAIAKSKLATLTKSIVDRNAQIEIGKSLVQARFAGDPTANEMLKSISATGGSGYVVSLDPTIEFVQGGGTPLLDALYPRRQPLDVISHTWYSDAYTDEDCAKTLGASVDPATSSDVNRASYSASVKQYEIMNQVNKIADAQKTVNGVSQLTTNRLAKVKAVRRSIEKDLFDGNTTVDAKEINGIDAFQATYGASALRVNAQGASLSFATIEEAIANMEENGGGSATHIFMGVQDDLAIQNLIRTYNVKDGTNAFGRFPTFPSSAGSTPALVMHSLIDSMKKVKATATHASGAVSFGGTVSNGDTVVVAGITYTAAASADATTNKFASGTAAVAMASLIAIVNDGLPAGTSTDKVTATAVGTTGANFTARAGGATGNAYTITGTGTNVTVNTATFSGGTNSKAYIINADALKLRELTVGESAGMVAFPVQATDWKTEIEAIAAFVLLQVGNPNAIAVIENIG